jgi:hypothetical protein
MIPKEKYISVPYLTSQAILNYLPTQLILWTRISLENPAAVQLIKKFQHFIKLEGPSSWPR